MKCVVVGAGSAGCVVARRLVDAGHDVVLFETGPPLERDAVPPAIDGADSFAALAEPGRTFERVVATRTLRSSPQRYWRGRGVGGSSAVNSMVALTGSLDLYASWGWDDVEADIGRILVPTEQARVSERGPVSSALLAADPRAELAQLTRAGGRRVTAAEAYLWPRRAEVDVRTEDPVDRVAVDEAGAATGVVTVAGHLEPADAVILCAGAIHTPAIMLRSGLRPSGIGEGLRDHPAAALTLQLRPGVAEAGATIEPRLVTAALLDRDPIQILPLDHLGPGAPAGLAVLLVALMRPVGSGGRVRLNSDDPTVEPRVEFDLLADPRDLSTLRSGVRSAVELLGTEPFARVVDDVFVDDVGTRLVELTADDSDAAIEEWLLDRGADYVHAACSTAAALEVDGRVMGHEGLFVADASAFPSIPDANTHFPTMMLAERFTRRWLDGGPLGSA